MSKRDGLIAGLLSVCLVGILYPLSLLGVDPHHDGIVLKPALDILSGQVLFRDTFNQYGALSAYLQSLAIWINPTLASVRLLTVAAYGVTLLFLYASWRMILPRSLTIAAGILFILFIPTYELDQWGEAYWSQLPWSSVFAMMFQSMAIYAFFRVIAGGRARYWGLLVGLSTACVLWTRQPVGIIMTGCLVVVWPILLASGWKAKGESNASVGIKILGGFCIVNFLMIAPLLIFGAWSEWWYQNIIWPSRWSSAVHWGPTAIKSLHVGTSLGLLLLLIAGALPGWIKKWRAGLSLRLVAIYYTGIALVLAWQHEWFWQVVDLRAGGWTIILPLLILVQAVISITSAWTRRGEPKFTEFYLIACLAGLSLGSILQYYPVADTRHIVWALAPGFGLGIYILWRALRWPALVTALGLGVILIPHTWAKYQTATQVLAEPTVTLHEPAILRGMRVTPAEAQDYAKIMAAIRPILEHFPRTPAVLIGKDALYLCFTENLTNPIPYYVTWLGLATNEQNLLRWKYVKRVRPMMFLMEARWDEVGNFYRESRYVPILYLEDEALEIAIPQELADSLGIGLYGAKVPVKPAATTTEP